MFIVLWRPYMSLLVEVVAKNLKYYRGLRGWTQGQLAKQIGVTIQTINRYEKGTAGISVPTITLLAKALEIEESDLVNPGEPPKPVTLKPSILEAVDLVAEMFGQYKKGEGTPLLDELIARILTDPRNKPD